MARALGLVVVILVLLVADHVGAARDACLIADRACVRCSPSNGNGNGSGGAARASCAACVEGAVLIDGTCSCPAGSGQTGKTYSSGEMHASVERRDVRPMSSGSSGVGGGTRRRRSGRLLLSSTADRLTCSACDAGAFAREASKSVRSARCTKCPTGTTTRGARGSTTCFVRAGFYFDPGRARGQQVVACPDGETCNGGDIFAEGQDHEVVVDPCSPNPCLNGGACKKTGASSYTCSCALGFSGADCGRARIIRTVAGVAGVAGKPEQRDMTAAKMILNNPHDIVYHKGFFYIPDRYNNWVLRIARDGQAQVVAGTGASGFAGDGGPAELARFRRPLSVAFDAEDNMYVSDEENFRVRKIDKNGIITTVAGNGQSTYVGDGNGKATEAPLHFPSAVGVDAKGNLFVAEPRRGIVRKVSLRDGTIERYAGTGVQGYSGDGGPALLAQLDAPQGFAFMQDNLLVADPGTSTVRKITSDGIISTIAGNGTYGYSGDNGPATSAQLWSPKGLAVDATTIYISDDGNTAIRKIDASGNISTVAGPPVPSWQYFITGVALDEENSIYTADPLFSTIRKFNKAGEGSVFAGKHGVKGCLDGGGVATSSRLNRPMGLAVDSAFNLYVADADNFRLRKISNNFMTTIAGIGAPAPYQTKGVPGPEQGMRETQGVAIDEAGNVLLTNPTDHHVYRLSTDGLIRGVVGYNFSDWDTGDLGPATSAAVRRPVSVAVSADGQTYFVVDQASHRVRRVDGKGIIHAFAGVWKEGAPTPGALATTSALSKPSGVAVAASGDVFISQQFCVLRVSALNGTISIVAGNPTEPGNADGPAAQAFFNGISDLDVDSAGVIYVADTKNNAVRVIGTDGVVRRLAGSPSGAAGFAGDNGPASAALLNGPMGVAIDREGNIYVSDTDNSVIRKIEK